MKNTKLPKWFKGQLYDKGDTVKNPFSGEVCELNAIELSMYAVSYTHLRAHET